MARASARVIIIAEPATATLCAEIVERQGHQPVLASTVEDVRRTLEGERVDLLVLDLSVANGPAMLAAARRLSPAPAVLALATPEECRQYDEAGVAGITDVASKPIERAELRCRLQMAVELHRLRTTEAYFRDIVHAVEEGVLITDSEALATYANPKMTQLLGLPAEEMIGKSVLSFIDPDAARIVKGQLQRRREGVRARYDVKVRRPDGLTLWVSISGSPLYDAIGQYTGAVGLVSDISAQKEAEEALRDAVQSRDKLLAIVSHDLRTPLSTIQLSARHLARRPLAEERRTGRKHLEVILRSTQRMNRLIDDLLQAATIEAGALSIQRVRENVLPMVEEAMASLEPLAANKSVHLECDVPPELPPVFCDAQRVLQVLINIVGNAVKFVSAGGTIAIRAEAREGYVLFSVSDDGPGIPPDQLPFLFDRYWKGTAKEGVGLGLFIAKGIVEAHGGQIRAESAVGVGSTFYFSIPVAPAQEQHAPAP